MDKITEWVMPGNNNDFRAVDAINKLGKIYWQQNGRTFNVGDIVYIYMSDPIKAIKLKCRITKINLKKVGNDDIEFYGPNHHTDDGKEYIEIEKIEELEGTAYKLDMLEKQGFKYPQSAKRVNSDEKKYLKLIQELQHSENINPDTYDATYELMRETISAYERMSDLSICDYKDMNLVYFTTVGTWKRSMIIRQKTIQGSHLPHEEKERLIELQNKLWEKAKKYKYSNHTDEVDIGMFGTGFNTFENKMNNALVQAFIKMCIDIAKMSDDDDIFKRCEIVLNKRFKGMKAASASMVLHCLKPYTFPIFNSNMGYESLFEYLGIEIKNKKEISTYIDNCRKVKEYRDANFNQINYRIFDIAAWDITKFERYVNHMNIDYLTVLDYLDNNRGLHYSDPTKVQDAIEAERLKEIKKSAQEAVEEIKNMAALCKKKFQLDKCEAIQWLDGSNTKTRKYLWAQMKYSKYADSPISISIFVEVPEEGTNKRARYRYSLEIRNTGANKDQMKQYYGFLDREKRKDLVYVQGSNEEKTPMELKDITANEIKDKINTGEISKVQLSRILERSNDLTNDECEKTMLEAVEELIPYYKHVIGAEESADLLDEKEETKDMNSSANDIKKRKSDKDEFDKNMILYGPPGTGKTYNTVLYAVAICSENETLKELQGKEYNEVKKQYDALKKQGRIAFTTFHQSYGYEEFIEGIRPLVNEVDGESDIQYEIKPGVFKKFCDDAKSNIVSKNSNVDIKKDATVWNVHLGEVSDHTLREKCFADGCIRIGWENSPEFITSDTDNLNKNTRASLLYFQEHMEIGDIVVSFRSVKTIDGIGIVTGKYEWDEKGDKTNPRKREVKWLSVKKEMNVYSLNGNTRLDINTVRYTQIKPADILALVDKNSQVVVETETRPYVFIIDEINRGNMSKIFGELITLIEDTKRLGAQEEMKAILPYTREEFGIPSNVYIIGTMNTADRSIAIMDTALRRRFHFIEMMPNLKLLKNDPNSGKLNGLDVREMLEKINERIGFLYDREHTIGHAFFMKLNNPKYRDIDTLAAIFKKSIIPLLQEYFYDDYEKIQLVLGDNGKKDETHKFIIDRKVEPKGVFIGDFDESIDLPEKKYEINDDAFHHIESYIEIYKHEE